MKDKSIKDQRAFDGRANYASDDAVEKMLVEHFGKFEVSPLEVAKSFQIYSRRTHLKRFLAHYELFRKTIDLPGDIVEFGVYRGASLMSWANFLEIHNMGDRQKQVFGFDNFSGFKSMDPKDGKEHRRVGKTMKGFDSEVFEPLIEDAINIFDHDRFVPHKPRIKLVKGDIEESVPAFVRDNPGLRISLLHFDCDMYRPTKVGLEQLWPLVVPGGIVLFDEYGIRPWEGESKAVDEYFSGKKIKFLRFPWSPNPGAYVAKES